MAGHHFTLYSTAGAPPNGWKVAMILEELGLDYKTIYLDFSKTMQKSEEFLKVNPNGRIPALVDHKNNDYTVWESNAIIHYVTEKYDPGHKISFTTLEDKIQFTQWLYFQSSGQGPYFGQAGWFLLFSKEKLPAVIERYQKEIIRVLGVLEKVLSQHCYLVGGKLSAADISFIPWNYLATNNLVKDFEGFNFEKDFPAVYRWHNEMMARPAISKVAATWQESFGW